MQLPWNRDDEPVVTLGTGKYGAPVHIPMSSLKKAIGIFGTSRSGKTRLANSIAAQQSRVLGCGQIILDFKGGKDMVLAKAELARQLGVGFQHFELVERGGGRYERVHPYCPPYRSHYDPFARGNGASKASMLLNSVPREGDAAAYKRSAYEAAQLAWDIAALSGIDQLKRNGKPLSGLEVLIEMLDPETLAKESSALRVDQVRAASGNTISPADAQQRIERIQTRLESLKKELGRNASLASSAVGDTGSLVATFLNSSALAGNLTPGASPTLRIDLMRAVLRGEIVLFSLPTQEYQEVASQVGTMVLLDLQNTVSTLRSRRADIAALTGKSLDSADSTPWTPTVFQMEEVGSIESEAAGTAMLGVFNKSADMGIRPIISSQSIGDMRKVDQGSGVFLNRLFGQMDHLVALQLTSSEDTKAFAAESEMVSKKRAIEEKSVERNRLRFFQGAGETERIRMNEQDETRIPATAVSELVRKDKGDIREMLYINKSEGTTCVHTNRPEGPNNWYEVLRMVPVLEKPHNWNPFDDPELADAEAQMEKSIGGLYNDITKGGKLHSLLSTRAEALNIDGPATTQMPAELAEEPNDDGRPDDAPPFEEEPDDTPFDYEEPPIDAFDDPFDDAQAHS